MRAKLTLNAILLGAVIVLALLALRPPAGDAEQPLLSALEPVQVTRIELQRDNEAATVLVLKDKRWRMLQPYPIDADETRVGFLLDFLGARSLTRFAVVQADLAKYGLDPPHATLTFNDERFEFGDQHPLAANRYVRVGDAVHLVSDIINQHLMAEPASYASPRLLEERSAIAAVEVSGLTVEHRDGKLTVSPDVGSADAVARFVEEWRDARAMRVRPFAPGESAGGADSAQVRLEDGRTLTFRIAGREPTLQLAREDLGLLYELTADAGKRLLSLDGGNNDKP